MEVGTWEYGEGRGEGEGRRGSKVHCGFVRSGLMGEVEWVWSGTEMVRCSWVVMLVVLVMGAMGRMGRGLRVLRLGILGKVSLVRGGVLLEALEKLAGEVVGARVREVAVVAVDEKETASGRVEGAMVNVDQESALARRPSGVGERRA